MEKKRKSPKKSTSKRRPVKNKPRHEKPRTGRPAGDIEDWAPAFINAITDGLHVVDAAALAKVHATMAYRRKKTDAAFRIEWEAAAKIGTKALEDEATRRAYHGTLKPVYQGGDLVGHIKEYSDTLIMFLLRGRKPKKYRDNHKVNVDLNANTEIVGIEVIVSPPKIAAPAETQ